MKKLLTLLLFSTLNMFSQEFNDIPDYIKVLKVEGTSEYISTGRTQTKRFLTRDEMQIIEDNRHETKIVTIKLDEYTEIEISPKTKID